MKNETRTQLDELMVTYEKIKDRSQDDFGHEDRGQQYFTTLRRDVIRPSMEAFSEVLRSHGHSVRIYGHEMAVDPGGHSRNAELLMHVVPRNGDRSSAAWPDGFVVTFSFDAPGRFLVVARGETPCPQPITGDAPVLRVLARGGMAGRRG